jgi:site-specific DNA-methyltransferase (adenine-specific)
MNAKLLKGNNIDLLKTLEPNSIDSVITDPPYGLAFMNKKWDYDVPSIEFWKEVYRVLKPGGHILSFGGTRTYHRMVVNIEDAGFEIRDCIQWIYGSGFPKSLNVGKTIDEYKGWGTGLKPANEPIVMARKPIAKKSIVENVLEYGTGGINIDGCRISTDEKIHYRTHCAVNQGTVFVGNGFGNYGYTQHNDGRFPVNVIFECTCDDDTHTNPECPCYIMDEQNNGASRFFYQAKVSKKERNMGLDGFEEKERFRLYETDTIKNWSEDSIKYQKRNPQKNNHPTVKPINLLTYLVRMVTPPNGVVMDCYMGSGSTGIAALLEGFNFIGMEMEEDYFNIAEARINNYEEYRKLLK